jgi:hypothetical protein
MGHTVFFAEGDLDGDAAVGTRDRRHCHPLTDWYDPVPCEDKDGMGAFGTGQSRPPGLSSGYFHSTLLTVSKAAPSSQWSASSG